jgi:hypothetical protein
MVSLAWGRHGLASSGWRRVLTALQWAGRPGPDILKHSKRGEM